MKKLFLIIAFLFVGAIGINAQCTEGSICVSQTTIDRASAAITELTAARDVIKRFESERLMTDAERQAATVLVKSLNDLLDTRARIILEYDKMVIVYQKVITMQGEIIDRLTKQLNKGKSGFQKVMDVLKTIGYILAGAGLGRIGL